MKTKLTIQLLTFCLLLSFSCGGGGGDDSPVPTAEELRLIDLAGTSGITWQASSITIDGSPISNTDAFSITLRGSVNDGKTYSSANASPLFNPTGTWDFYNNSLNQVVVDGDADHVYTITNLNTTTQPATMTLTVNYTGQGGVAAGSGGLYTINLQAQ